MTGCKKPCHYKKYSFIGQEQTTSFTHEDFNFSLWAVSNATTLETEVLVYPLTSLVADFGGTLSSESDKLKLITFLVVLKEDKLITNKPAAQLAGADPSWCIASKQANSTYFSKIGVTFKLGL